MMRQRRSGQRKDDWMSVTATRPGQPNQRQHLGRPKQLDIKIGALGPEQLSLGDCRGVKMASDPLNTERHQWKGLSRQQTQ